MNERNRSLYPTLKFAVHYLGKIYSVTVCVEKIMMNEVKVHFIAMKHEKK